MSSTQNSTDLITIYAGWVIDGSGGAIRKNVRIRVCNGIIAAMEPSPGHEDLPGGIDLAGYTVLPCLVDSHVHLFMSGTADPKVRVRQLEAPFNEARKVIDDHIAASLATGITAVRDGGDHHAHALRYRDESLDAAKIHFQLQAAGSAWHRAGRYGKLIGRPPAGGYSLAEAILREKAAVDHVKIVNSGLNSLIKFGHQTAPQFSLGEMEAAVHAARRKGLSVMVHANGKIPVGIAISGGCRSIEHGFFMGKENLRKMAEKDIFWIPTAATMQAYSDHWEQIGENPDIARRNLEHQMEQIATARELGVPIAAGTDAGSIGVHHGRGIVLELRILQRSGFPIQQAIQCATANGARLLNLPDPHVLARGLPAAFIAVKGSPAGLPDSLLSVEKILQ